MTDKPFDNGFVIRETLRRMQGCVDKSIQKTLTRMPEFRDNPEKMHEVLVTLGNLSRLTKMIDEVKDHNNNIIGE